MVLQTLFPLFISDSDSTAWSQCELRWFRARCQWLTKEGFNIDLAAGSAFAAGIELVRKRYYNEGIDETQAIEEGYNYILDSLHESEWQDDLKSPERMALALKQYFKEFPLEDDLPVKLEDGSFAIEHKFSIELPITHPELGVPLIFTGRLDMLAERMGRLYLVDEKTCKSYLQNEGDMLATNSQFISYAWVARKLGVNINGAAIRKVAIQKGGIKLKEFEFPITQYTVDLWEKAFFNKLQTMVDKYKLVLKNPEKFKEYFIPDFKLGCTSFYRPCNFRDGCLSENGDRFIKAEYEQLCGESGEAKTIAIGDFREMLGLLK